MVIVESHRFHRNSARTSVGHIAPWIHTTISEMHTFLATVILMPRSKIKPYS